MTRLRQVLAELELMSHVSAVNLDPSSRDAGEDIGGKRPPGGVDRREDRHRPEKGEETENERVLRSAQHFRERLARGASPIMVLADAEASLAAWRRQPATGDWPEYGTPGWKRWVGECRFSSEEIATMYVISRRYVNRVRALYRPAA